MKSKLIKRISVATGVLATSLFLGACGNANDSEGSNDERTQVRITWRGQGEDDQLGRFFEDYFIPQFETDNPDLEIVLAPIVASEADYFARVALAMQSEDTAPDVVAQDSFQLNADASAGFLLPLDDFVNAWDEWEYYTDNLKEGFRAQSGNLYAIPGTSDSRGLWFNREVLREAGLPEDWQPTTWDEILDAAEAIRDNTDAVPLSMNVARSAGEAVTMQTFLMFLHGTGEVLFDHDSEKWVVSSQGFLDSLNFIDEVFNQRNLGPDLSIAMSTNYSAIMMQDKLPNGQAGIILDGFWNIGNFLPTGPVPLEDPEAILGFAAMPTQNGQGNGSVTMAGGWGWSIPANSQNHEDAWRVLQALGSKENQAQRTILDGNLTVREDSATVPNYIERPFMEEATSFLENAYFRPAREEYPQISVEIQMAVEAVASGSSTPEEAMTEFQRNVTRIVGEENTISR